jgi:two-component system, NtrC family, sensor kinase
LTRAFIVPRVRGTINGRAILGRRTVYVADLQAETEEFPEVSQYARRFGVRTSLSVPLMTEGVAVGTIHLRRTEAQLFTERQVALLQTFADRAVITIENTRLFEAERERTRQLTEALEQQTAMSEILRVISSSPSDAQPAFDTIAQSAARLCKALFCHVFRFDGELLQFVAHHGLPPEGIAEIRSTYPLPPGRASAAARSILSGTVEEIPDVDADPDYQHGPGAKIIGYRSIVAVPMLADGRPIGAIAAAQRQSGHFPERRIALLRTFADQAVIAIENARSAVYSCAACRRSRLPKSRLRSWKPSPNRPSSLSITPACSKRFRRRRGSCKSRSNIRPRPATCSVLYLPRPTSFSRC